MSVEKVIYANEEHDSVRIFVLFIMVVGTVGGFVLWRAVLPEFGFKTLVSCGGGVALALLGAALVESGSKRAWPSEKRFSITAQGMVQSRPGQSPLTFTAKNYAMTTYWYFPLTDYPRGGRERRFANHWLCLACQLQQDEDRMNVYCFISPRKAEALLAQFNFQQIYPKDIYDTSFRARMTLPTRPEIPPEIIAGKEGRLWLAERNRWHDGIELSPADFLTFLNATKTFATV